MVCLRFDLLPTLFRADFGAEPPFPLCTQNGGQDGAVSYGVQRGVDVSKGRSR